MIKKWTYKSDKLITNQDELYSEMLNSLNVNEESMADFLSCDFEFDPFSLIDIELAVDRIDIAIQSGEKVLIYGDYDADGITATTILYRYLKDQCNVSYYLPHRQKDGYGLNAKNIAKFKEDGISLIITVDNGISAIEAVDCCNELGIDVIVTDHHMPNVTLPDAYCIVDPHRTDCESGYTYICGAGVALCLVMAHSGDEDYALENFASLAAIGTIADIMPLVGFNRKVVKIGIEQLKENPSIGIEKLLEQGKIDSSRLNSTSIAFSLVPRINASGRMDSAMLALEILITDDKLQAEKLATELEKLNIDRKDEEMKIVNECIKKIEMDTSILDSDVLTLWGKNWHEGVIGIVASRILERYLRPTVIISVDEDGNAKGSARSKTGFNIFGAFKSCEDLLLKYGGHAMAAGVLLKEENLNAFANRLTELSSKMNLKPLYQETEISCVVNTDVITLDFLENLELLEPFGVGNPRPVFAVKMAEISCVDALSSGRFVKVTVSDSKGSIQLLDFAHSIEQFSYKVGDKVDICFTVDKNVFKGNCSISYKLVDMKTVVDVSSEQILDTYYNYYKTGYKPEKLPTREQAGEIYREIKINGFTDCFALSLKTKLDIEQVLVALDCFYETGILTREFKGGAVCAKIVDINTKVNIFETEAYKRGL